MQTKGFEFMDKELVISDENVEKAVRYAVEVRDSSAIAALRVWLDT